MVSFSILADGTIVYDEYSTPAMWSRVTLAHTSRIAWCCLFCYFVSELRRGGLRACPQLSSYSWWGCEYNMYRSLTKQYLQPFWEKLMYVSYTWLARVSSRAFRRCSKLKFVCGFFNMVDLRFMGYICQDDIAPGEFWLLQCACQLFFGLGTSTHVCSWSINDCYIFKQHGSHAWYGCWTIKALVEAGVLYDGFTLSRGCIAVPLIIARLLGVLLLISNYKTSINPT